MILLIFITLAFADEGQDPISTGTAHCSAPTHCEITSTGAYYLSGDLTVPLVISASDVYLDLNGYSVTDVSGGTPALQRWGTYSGLTVVNGSLAGCEVLGAPGSTATTFERVRFSPDGSGDVLVAGHGTPLVVRDSSFSGATTSPCVYGADLAGAVIEDSTFRQCAGIYLYTSTGGVIRRNTVRTIQAYGIELDHCVGVRVEGNTLSGMEDYGIYAHGMATSSGTGRHVILGNPSSTKVPIITGSGSSSSETP